MKHFAGTCALAAFLTHFPALAVAGDFLSNPYELRLLSALDRQCARATAMGRQASLAATDGASRNPAGDAWGGQQGRGEGFSIASIHAVSQSGSWNMATAIDSGKFRLADGGGTWSLAYARTDAPDESARGGFHDGLQSNEFFLNYARKVAPDLSLGIQGRLVDAAIKRQSPLAAFGGRSGEVATDLLSLDVTPGILGSVGEHFTWGMVLALGFSSADAEVSNLAQVGLSPPGAIRVTETDAVRTIGIRGGLGWHANNGVAYYTDLEHLHVSTNKAGSLDRSRLAIGLEQSISSVWGMRLGLSRDSLGETTVSGGLTYRGWKSVAIQVAYQHNTAPETRPEFGRVDFLDLVVSFPL
jgi:hypothetical protein